MRKKQIRKRLKGYNDYIKAKRLSTKRDDLVSEGHALVESMLPPGVWTSHFYWNTDTDYFIDFGSNRHFFTDVVPQLKAIQRALDALTGSTMKIHFYPV